jgi:hypothetical protein
MHLDEKSNTVLLYRRVVYTVETEVLWIKFIHDWSNLEPTQKTLHCVNTVLLYRRVVYTVETEVLWIKFIHDWSNLNVSLHTIVEMARCFLNALHMAHTLCSHVEDWTLPCRYIV